MRDLTTEAQAAFLASAKLPAFFWEGEFNTGTLRLWSGVGPIEWNGHTWSGAGDLAGISPIEETTDVVANGISFSFSGIDPSMIATALGEITQGRPVKLWLGMLQQDGSVIADPSMVFAGRMDVPTIDEGAETSTITLTVESRLVALNTPRIRRWTPEDQKLRDPTDKGFEYINGLQEAEIVWG